MPQTEALLTDLGQSQRHVAPAVDRLLRLLDEYGQGVLSFAVAEALAAGSPHPETARLALDRRHLRQTAPLPVTFPDDPRVGDLVVVPHDLADYDPEEPHE